MATRSTRPLVVETEEAIIQHFLKRLARGARGALDLTDDAAYLTPKPDHDLVLTKDALVAGVHFFPDDAPAEIGYKALAVNISDLAAKGARPLGYLMALMLPAAPKARWLEGLADGLAAMQKTADCHLLGGDTVRTPGPLAITITAIGELPKGSMVKRCGGKAGDLLFVSGSIGDAALGLALRRDRQAAVRWGLDAKSASFLVARYLRPSPRLALQQPLRQFAHAAMDISDGLLIDVTRMAACSQLGARIEAALVPLSPATRQAIAREPHLLETALTGGDDYEVLAAVPAAAAEAFAAAAKAAGCPVEQIGSLSKAATGTLVMDDQGTPITFSRLGYDHF